MSTRPQSSQKARGFGLLVTNVTKLAGVVIALDETLIRTEPRSVALAVAALMIAGAQGLESIVERMLER